MMDAHHAAVIDIRWRKHNINDNDGVNNHQPSITVQMVDTNDFPADPIVQQRVEAHEAILKELDKAKLFKIRDWVKDSTNHKYNHNHHDTNKTEEVTFSTQNNRLEPSTGTTALCSMLRMGLRCEVTLLNAGCVRADHDYSNQEYFTWSDMKTELPYETRMMTAYVPGRVIQETIRYSRRYAKDGIANGGYLHASRTTVCTPDGTIQSILGEKFDPNREYLTAFPYGLLQGMDDPKPFLEWAATKQPDELPSSHSAVPAKVVLVEFFSALLWLRFGSFEEMAQGDERICKEDVRDRMRHLYGNHHEVADLMADSVFAIADKDGDGSISAVEQMITRFVAADMLHHVVTEKELEAMQNAAAQVLGKDPSHEEVDHIVKQIKDALDLKGNGSIQREEIIHALGEVAGRDLLQ